MNKLNAIIIVLFIILLGMAGYYFFYEPKSDTSPDTKASTDSISVSKNLENTTFAVSGSVTKVEGNTITIHSIMVKDGKTSSFDPTLTVDSKVTILVNNRTRASLSDIKVGSNITVYTKVYPYDQSKLTPFSISVQR